MGVLRFTMAMIIRFAVAAGLGIVVQVSAAPPSPDFDGDGFDDLAVGIPNFDVDGSANVGGVSVIYGTGLGLRVTGNQLITQNTPGIIDEAEEGDRFGHALTWGDFNGDGFSDLAVGIPLEDVDDTPNAGAVHVIYGSADGLSDDDDQLWHQDSQGISDVAEFGDQFGWAVASGDFNNDGFDDLAIGIISEDIDLNPNAGAVAVLYGNERGLRSFKQQFWSQALSGMDDRAEPSDQFGFALITGDFNGDGRDDLAIGIPGEDIGGSNFIGQKLDAGAVAVIYGANGGLTPSGRQFWHQDSPGVVGTADIDERFGWSLASGDFNGDGRDDLAIGVPEEDQGFQADVGAVNILYGNNTGLRSTGSQLFGQDSIGVANTAEARDRFGFSLAAGDFNADGRDDLAVGSPGENGDFSTLPGSIAASGDAIGGVHVLRGTSDGLSGASSRFFHQDVVGIRGTTANRDRFGEALHTGDFNGDGRFDLAIGIPGEAANRFDAFGLVTNAGAVAVLYGSSGAAGAGVTSTGNQLWSLDSPGILGFSQRGDMFSMRGPTSD